MKEEKKDLIIKNFKTIILEDGYSKLSINYLTSKCKISKGSFYTYFSSKDEILSLLVDEYIDFLKNLNKKWEIECQSLAEILEKYFTYRKNLTNAELELEMSIINLVKNFEIIDDENLKKIYSINQIWQDFIENSLKKYMSISNEKIEIYSNIINGIKDKFHFLEIIELESEGPRFKKIKEVEKIFKRKKYIEKYNFIIENLKKILI